MNNISTIIVAKDNPSHLKETIESANFSDEIIIVDIGMTPGCKQEIMQMPKVRIETMTEDIKYVELIREKTKQFARNEYLLFLDPDEVISHNLQEIFINESINYDYVAMPRKNIILGKWIEHSRWWPDYQIRLFKKDAVMWPQILHAQPEVHGRELKIEDTEQNALIHYNYENITEFFTKMVRYAESEAKEIITGSKQYTLTVAIKESLQEFVSRFFAEKGYQDGMHGLALAFFQMMYKMLVYFYVWELQKYPVTSEKELVEAPEKFFKQGLYETHFWLIKEKLVEFGTALKYKVINKVLLK